MENAHRLVDRLTSWFHRFDPRLYQIASLTTLLCYGILWLHFDVPVAQISLTFGAALLTQFAGTRFSRLPAFDPLSAIVSAVGLCIFLRTNHPGVAALAAGIAIGSKFIIRWEKKHLFNPTNLALLLMTTSGFGWISPGQWGQTAWFGFLIACLGSFVVSRAVRADVTLSFGLLRRPSHDTGALARRSALHSLASNRKRYPSHFLILHDHRP